MDSLKKSYFDAISLLFQPKFLEQCFIPTQDYRIEKVQNEYYILSIYIIRVSLIVYNLQPPFLNPRKHAFSRIKMSLNKFQRKTARLRAVAARSRG